MATVGIKPKWDKAHIWAFTTYFTEGFPFSIIRTVSSVFFRDMKVSLEAIGLTPLYGLPWILKFLWGPQVDEYSTKKRWLLSMQAGLLSMMLAAALLAPLDIGVPAIAVLFFIGSIVAATHDIAIDGYYMEALDKEGQAKFVGYRVMAYRIAMMTGSGVIVSIGANWGWSWAFLGAALVFGLFFLYHCFFLDEVESPGKSIRVLFFRGMKVKAILLFLFSLFFIIGFRYFFQSPFYERLKEKTPLLKEIGFPHWVALLLLVALIVLGLTGKKIKARLTRDPDSFYGKAFIYFMEREKISLILTFIILMRVGEWALTTMVAPFIVDLGLKSHYGWISGLVGMPAAIVGAMLGGWMISRFSLKKVIWPFILIQNLTNVLYMILAFYLRPFIETNTGAVTPVPIGLGNLGLVAFVHGFDQLAGGLGNAVLMTYLMRICHQEYKAAHYAIGSGLMNLGGLFTGVASGFIAGWLGYGWVFGFSFLVSLPAMFLIPFLPYL